ncbi:hypothetical protein ACTXT7_008933 [Hymenolepis weldensis]
MHTYSKRSVLENFSYNNSYLQHWNNAPGPGNSNAMATQQQQQPPPNFDEAAAAAAAMMTNGGAGGGVVVVSSGAQMNPSPTLPPTYNPPIGVGDRRLITSPPMGGGSTLQPQPPQQPGGMQYAPPRFTPPTQIYHHNPAMQPPSQMVFSTATPVQAANSDMKLNPPANNSVSANHSVRKVIVFRNVTQLSCTRFEDLRGLDGEFVDNLKRQLLVSQTKETAEEIL